MHYLQSDQQENKAENKPATVKGTQGVAAMQGTRDIEKALWRLQHENRVYVLRIACCLGCWLLAGLFLALLASTPAGGGQTNMGELLLCLLFVVAGVVAVPSSRSPALDMLEAAQDVRAVGPLLDALDVSTATKAHAIKRLLTTLLPRLTAVDAWLVTRSQRRKLYDWLTLGDADHDLDYLLAIVTSLEHIGDAETLCQINQLEQRGAVTSGQARVRQAIQACLLSLAARLEREQVSASLLRASIPPINPIELLRPPHSPPDHPAETLLRPLE